MAKSTRQHILFIFALINMRSGILAEILYLKIPENSMHLII